MAWNPDPEVAAARDFGGKFGADQVVILYRLRDGRCAYASWGKTKGLCDATKTLADSAYETFADCIDLQDGRPEPPAPGGDLYGGDGQDTRALRG